MECNQDLGYSGAHSIESTGGLLGPPTEIRLLSVWNCLTSEWNIAVFCDTCDGMIASLLPHTRWPYMVANCWKLNQSLSHAAAKPHLLGCKEFVFTHALTTRVGPFSVQMKASFLRPFWSRWPLKTWVGIKYWDVAAHLGFWMQIKLAAIFLNTLFFAETNSKCGFHIQK